MLQTLKISKIYIPVIDRRPQIIQYFVTFNDLFITNYHIISNE